MLSFLQLYRVYTFTRALYFVTVTRDRDSDSKDCSIFGRVIYGRPM